MNAYSSFGKNTQVLVIGGGPAGSYAATVLSLEGLNVTLLESAVFPRPVNHVCVSLHLS